MDMQTYLTLYSRSQSSHHCPSVPADRNICMFVHIYECLYRSVMSGESAVVRDASEKR